MEPPSLNKRATLSVAKPTPTGPTPRQLREQLQQAQDQLQQLQEHRVDLEAQNEALRHARDVKESSSDYYFCLYDFAPVGYVTLSETGMILQCNRTAATLLGETVAQLEGRWFARLILDEDRDPFHSLRARLRSQGLEQTCELRMLRHGSAPFWAHLACSSQRNIGEREVDVVLSDITPRKLAQAKLQLAASVFTHAREGILITTPQGLIIDVNEAFTRITGYERSEVLGQNPRLLNSGRHEVEFFAAMWRDLLGAGRWQGELWNRRKTGEVYAEMKTISAVHAPNGKLEHFVALFSDITKSKERESELENIVQYNTLTALPNRLLLADRLRHAMALTRRRRQRLTLVNLELDGFKDIIDRHGHETGDLLLIALSIRMKQAMRESDSLAYLEGGEFVAVLPELADVATSTAMLLRLASDAARPVQVGELMLQVSASLGVTYYPQARDVTAEQLLLQADQARCQAKLAGKNRHHTFDAWSDASSAL